MRIAQRAAKEPSHDDQSFRTGEDLTPFLPRGRFAAGNQGEQSKSDGANVQLPPNLKIASGSGSYHEAAIQEATQAERVGKN